MLNVSLLIFLKSYKTTNGDLQCSKNFKVWKNNASGFYNLCRLGRHLSVASGYTKLYITQTTLPKDTRQDWSFLGIIKYKELTIVRHLLMLSKWSLFVLFLLLQPRNSGKFIKWMFTMHFSMEIFKKMYT